MFPFKDLIKKFVMCLVFMTLKGRSLVILFETKVGRDEEYNLFIFRFLCL